MKNTECKDVDTTPAWFGRALMAWFGALAAAAMLIPGIVVARALFFPPSAAEVDANLTRIIDQGNAEASAGKCPLTWREDTDKEGRKTCVLQVTE